MSQPYPKIAISRREFATLLEYSTSIPTGTAAGKRWKRADWPRHNGISDAWHMGEYGEPYPEGHEYHGQVPIIWRQIIVVGALRRFPRDIAVPPPPMRGRIRLEERA